MQFFSGRNCLGLPVSFSSLLPVLPDWWCLSHISANAIVDIWEPSPGLPSPMTRCRYWLPAQRERLSGSDWALINPLPLTFLSLAGSSLVKKGPRLPSTVWGSSLGEVGRATLQEQGRTGTGLASAVPSSSGRLSLCGLTVILHLLLYLHAQGTWEALTLGVSASNSEMK